MKQLVLTLKQLNLVSFKQLFFGPTFLWTQNFFGPEILDKKI